jgi:hypothetical protein
VTFVLQDMTNHHSTHGMQMLPLVSAPVRKIGGSLSSRSNRKARTAWSSGGTLTVDYFDTSMFETLRRHAPAGTTSTFVGDQLGRSGWEVTLPDGSKNQVYFSLPTELARFSLSVADAPEGFSFEQDLPAWRDTLGEIVKQAREMFGNPPAVV